MDVFEYEVVIKEKIEERSIFAEVDGCVPCLAITNAVRAKEIGGTIASQLPSDTENARFCVPPSRTGMRRSRRDV